MGIAQEEEKLAAEALARQQTQGVVGKWEVVESTGSAQASSVLPQKRPHQQEDEDEEGEGFKVRRRKLAEGLGEIYDPGKITIAPRKEKVEAAPEKVGEENSDTTQNPPKERLTWSTKRWKTGTTDGQGEDEPRAPSILVEETQTEAQVELPPDKEHALAPPEGTPLEPVPEPSLEPATEPAPAKSMFKKRKAPGQQVGQKSGLRKQL